MKDSMKVKSCKIDNESNINCNDMMIYFYRVWRVEEGETCSSGEYLVSLLGY